MIDSEQAYGLFMWTLLCLLGGLLLSKTENTSDQLIIEQKAFELDGSIYKCKNISVIKDM